MHTNQIWHNKLHLKVLPLKYTVLYVFSYSSDCSQHKSLQTLFLVLYVHVSCVSINSTFQNKKFSTPKKKFQKHWCKWLNKMSNYLLNPSEVWDKSYEICSVLEKSKGYTEVVTCFLIEHIKGKVKWTVISCNSAKI